MLTVNNELIKALCCTTGLSKNKLFEKLKLKKYFNYSYFCRITDLKGNPTLENIEVIQKSLDNTFTTSELIEIAKIQNILLKKRG